MKRRIGISVPISRVRERHDQFAGKSRRVVGQGDSVGSALTGRQIAFPVLKGRADERGDRHVRRLPGQIDFAGIYPQRAVFVGIGCKLVQCQNERFTAVWVKTKG